MKSSPLLLAVCLLFLASCEWIEDPGKIKTPTWNPSFAAAILNTEVSLQDALDQVNAEDYIEVDSLGNISLTYSSNLLSQQSLEIVDIPDFNIPMPVSELSFPFPLDQVDRVDLKEGRMQVNFQSSTNEAFRVVLSVNDLYIGGQPYQYTFEFQGNGEHSIDVQLSGMSFRPSDGEINLSYEAELISDQSPISLENVSFTFSEMKFDYIQGYFGQQSLEFNMDSLTWDLGEGLGDLEYNLIEPDIKLFVRHSFGIPLEFRVDRLQVFKEGENPVDLRSEELSEGVLLSYPDPAEIGQSKTTLIRLNHENSNLSQALSMLPEGLSWSIGAEVYPDGDSSRSSFLLDSSALSVDVEARLPLKGSLSSLTFEQVIETELEAIDEVEAGGLRLFTENGLPLDIDLQVYFLDENQTSIDSLFEGITPLLEAAQVDEEGQVIAASPSQLDIQLEREKLDRLFEAKAFRIKARVSTAAGGQRTVQFNAHQQLKIQMGLSGSALIE